LDAGELLLGRIVLAHIVDMETVFSTTQTGLDVAFLAEIRSAQ